LPVNFSALLNAQFTFSAKTRSFQEQLYNAEDKVLDKTCPVLSF